MKDKPVILVVDDQPQNIELLEAYLVPQGYEIVKAANGEEALGKLAGNPIDLILLDVMMPGIDGFEVTRRVRQDENTRLLPIILVTALREKEDRVRGIEAGCDDFVSKPVDKIELLARVRSLLKVKAYNDLLTNYRNELELRAHLLDSATDSIFLHDVEGNFIYVNEAAYKTRGYTKDELMAINLHELDTPEYAGLIEPNIEYLINHGEAPFESAHLNKDGSVMPVEIHAHILNINGKKQILSVIRDITERKKTEEIIQASLKEKETLLKEVHHRVKNNMQVISSLLHLQALNIRDKDALAMLKDSQSRIQSMALVYNKLYQSRNLASIDMSDYIEELTGGLIKSYTHNPDRVTASIDPSDVFLGIDTAIPCGLVINELVTNSLKYAFPENRTGKIAISLKEGGNQELELVVSDNGVGIPEGINMEKSSTLGLKLVTNLVREQLDGKIELDGSQGTTFKITFHRAKEKK